jgi:hypothetical protein
MIKVTPRARRHTDRAGDPLDGLVNMFDIGIVLAVAFVLAALSSLGLKEAVKDGGLVKPAVGEVVLKPGERLDDVPSEGVKTVGRGTAVGTVYRLADGRLVYVTSDGSSEPMSEPAPSTDGFGSTPTPAPTDSPSPTPTATPEPGLDGTSTRPRPTVTPFS